MDDADDIVDDEPQALTYPAGTVLALHPFALTVTGVEIMRDATFKEWEEAFTQIKRIHGAATFWLGDLLNYGESKWGEKYSQALDATEYEEQTLRNAAWVAKQIPRERRRNLDKVSYSHHAEIAALDPEQQDHWLQRVEMDGMSRDALRIAIRQQKRALEGFDGSFWIKVQCATEKDQFDLAERLRNEGRSVKVL